MNKRLTLIAFSTVFGIMGATVANAGRYVDNHMLKHESGNMANSVMHSRSTSAPFAGRYADRPRHPELNREVEAEFAVMDVGDDIDPARLDRHAHPHGGRHPDRVHIMR